MPVFTSLWQRDAICLHLLWMWFNVTAKACFVPVWPWESLSLSSSSSARCRCRSKKPAAEKLQWRESKKMVDAVKEMFLLHWCRDLSIAAHYFNHHRGSNILSRLPISLYYRKGDRDQDQHLRHKLRSSLWHWNGKRISFLRWCDAIWQFLSHTAELSLKTCFVVFYM